MALTIPPLKGLATLHPQSIREEAPQVKAHQLKLLNDSTPTPEGKARARQTRPLRQKQVPPFHLPVVKGSSCPSQKHEPQQRAEAADNQACNAAAQHGLSLRRFCEA